MAEKFEKDDLVLCVSTHGFTDARFNFPELLEQYTIQEVLFDGTVRLNEINNELYDSLLAKGGLYDLLGFYPWHFIKLGKSKSYWAAQIRESARQRNHLWKDRKITIINVEETLVTFHMQGMKFGVLTATKEFLLKH